MARSKDGLSVTFRFVDFGEEIIAVTSIRASGDATGKMAQLQRPFFTKLAQMPHDYPLVGSDDMMEQMILLGGF